MVKVYNGIENAWRSLLHRTVSFSDLLTLAWTHHGTTTDIIELCFSEMKFLLFSQMELFFTSFKLRFGTHSFYIFSSTNSKANSINSPSSKVSSWSSSSSSLWFITTPNNVHYFCNWEWNIISSLNHLSQKRFPTCSNYWWFNFCVNWWHDSNTIIFVVFYSVKNSLENSLLLTINCT